MPLPLNIYTFSSSWFIKVSKAPILADLSPSRIWNNIWHHERITYSFSRGIFFRNPVFILIYLQTTALPSSFSLFSEVFCFKTWSDYKYFSVSIQTNNHATEKTFHLIWGILILEISFQNMLSVFGLCNYGPWMLLADSQLRHEANSSNRFS